MEENNEEKKQISKGKWVIPTITTLIGVVVSILVAWYQIKINEEQTLQAEIERAKSVKNELVLIVEEHIINQKPLDISRLARISEFRAKQEKLLVIPSVSEIVENAEFNILKSQYLEFEKKQQFKEIFNGIYAEITIPENVKYNGLFENTVNDIYASIQKGSTKDITSKVSKLVSDFNSRISELEAEKSLRKKLDINDVIEAISDKPSTLIIAMSVYLFIISIMFFSLRRIRYRRKILEELLKDKDKCE